MSFDLIDAIHAALLTIIDEQGAMLYRFGMFNGICIGMTSASISVRGTTWAYMHGSDDGDGILCSGQGRRIF